MYSFDVTLSTEMYVNRAIAEVNYLIVQIDKLKVAIKPAPTADHTTNKFSKFIYKFPTGIKRLIRHQVKFMNRLTVFL